MLSNRFAYRLLCFILLLVTGCQTSALPAKQTTVSPSVNTSTATLVLTPKITEMTPVSVLTNTPTIVPEVVLDPSKAAIIKLCPDISSHISRNSARGTLVLNERNGSIKLLNLETGTETDFTLGLPVVVSPDRNQLAFNDINQNTLETRLAVGTLGDMKQKEFAYQKSWFSVVRWQNDHSLLIRMLSDSAPYPVAILDIETGKSKSLVPNFPNISLNMTDWDGAGPAAYNAMIDRVVYAGWNESSKVYEYVLWDMFNNKQIMSFTGSSFSGDGVNHNAPEWSPDGSRVAIISIEPGLNSKKDEIFDLNKDGKVQRLTYFADHFEKIKIGSMTWSPDGKNIAFWVTLEPGPYKPDAGTYQDMRLAILNTESFETTIYCISGDSVGPENGVPSSKFLILPVGAPIWSPDGTHVIVENRYSDNFSRLILLDIANKTAIDLGKDIQPLGWMENTP
jgi:hypothetical protein